LDPYIALREAYHQYRQNKIGKMKNRAKRILIQNLKSASPLLFKEGAFNGSLPFDSHSLCFGNGEMADIPVF